jgi:hypothetical protein
MIERSPQSPPAPLATDSDRHFAYHVLRYVPDLLRDEWVNIGVLAFNPESGERRFRLIEEKEEFGRVRRLHPAADEGVLRSLQENLNSRFEAALAGDRANGGNSPSNWESIVAKWDATLSNLVQLSSARGSLGSDLDSEVDRLYANHVAMRRSQGRTGVFGSRGNLRSYCAEVFKQARLWGRMEKRVQVAEFTFPGDPMRLDFSYRRNGTRGFVHTLSVSRSPADAKLLAYTADHIQKKADFASEFAVVTDVPLLSGNERHNFVRDTLRDVRIEPVPQEGFAVWVAKLRPMLLQ